MRGLMNTKKIFSYIIIGTLIAFMTSTGCITDFLPAVPTTPEIPGTQKIELQLPDNGATISSGGTFQYAPPATVSYLTLVIGDTDKLRVSEGLVENIKYGSTTDLGMGRNSVTTDSIKVYNATTFTFSGTPPAGSYSGSWFVIGYDTNMNLIASSPKWTVTIDSW